MAILTQEGLVIRRYPEIVRVIQDALKQNVSSELDFSEDTLISKIVDIISNEFSVMEAVIQQLNDSRDRDKAEGASLDELLYLIGLKRQRAFKSSGFVQFVGRDNSVIPNNSIVVNVANGNLFVTTQAGLIDKGNCQATWLKPVVANSTTYAVIIDSNTYSYTSTASATADEIIGGLASTISNTTSTSYTAQSYSDEDGESLMVMSTDIQTNISVAFVQGWNTYQVKVSVPVESTEFGSVIAPENTITELASSVAGVYSVTNEQALGVGRLTETDAEFKLRASRSLSVSGSGTYNALYTALSNLDGVNNLVLLENNTKLTDQYGLPPSSFEVIADVPNTPENDRAVANLLWEEKPLGIESYGDVQTTIKDVAGNDRVLSFSRPMPERAAIKVTYKEYDEEEQIDNIIEVIKDSIMETAKGLTTGKDIIPSRFIGGVYSATQSGIGEVVVYAQTIPTDESTPNPALWTTDKIPVSPKYYASILRANIEVELL